jgi:hypothetical protein
MLILPTQVRNGKAYYLPVDTEARRIAKSVGVNARFLYDGTSRSYLHEYSAGWILDLAVAIGQNISADLILGVGKYVLARAQNMVLRGVYGGEAERLPLKVTIQRAAQNERGEMELDGLSFEGEAGAVVDAIREVFSSAGITGRDACVREVGPGGGSQ